MFGLALLLSLAAWSADRVHRPAIPVEGQELPAASKSQELDHRLRCSIGATVRMAVDLSVPLLNTTGRAGCDFRPNHPPNVIGFVLGLFLQVMGWVFATLFVVGFTGVVRRECPGLSATSHVDLPGGERPAWAVFVLGPTAVSAVDGTPEHLTPSSART